MKTQIIVNPDGSVMYSTDISNTLETIKKKAVFEQYSEKVVYYQRFIRTSITEEMAKGILELCAALIYNENVSDEEMDEFAESVAEKRHLDLEEMIEEFNKFLEYAPPSEVVNEIWGD